MKKLLLLLYMFLIFLVIGCSSESLESSLNEESKKEITIVTSVKDFYRLQPVLADYVINFEAKNGAKVKIEELDYNNYDDYIEKLNTKLYMKEGPTLIYFSNSESYSKYIDAGVALNADNVILNYDKVYDSLKYKDCFIPISMNYVSTNLNKEVLDKLEVKVPSINWTKEEYLKIKEKWLNQQEVMYFNYVEYRDIVEEPIRELDLVNMEVKKVYLNTEEVKDLINKAREEIFSGFYIIEPQYNYMNYYNMFFDSKSDEYSKRMEFDFNNRYKVLESRFGESALKTFVTSPKIEEGNEIILPRIDYNRALSVSGFILNRNGVNIELGIEFLNGLLSDEVQLSLFNELTYGGYPVNKNIESKISEIEKEKGINEEAIALRKYIIKNIEDGIYRPFRQMNSELYEFYSKLQKDLMILIFSNEEYSDEELSRELQKLENEYTMWLRE